MSKKSKKELAKAEAMMAKALKMQAKAKKMQHEAARMQLTMLQATTGASYLHPESAGGLPGPDPTYAPPERAQADISAAPAGNTAQAEPLNDAGLWSRARTHIRSNPFLYAAIGAVVLIAGVYLAFARTPPRMPAAAAAIAERGDTAEQAAPPADASGLPSTVTVLDTWTMPKELLEISSNAFLDADRVACIQDNDGIIYTYNLKTRQVENRLKFAPPGDFEALSVVGNTFYALRSDGRLFEVQPGTSGKPAVKEYDLPLKAAQDTEPMFYDKANNRLLVGVKEQDPGSSDFKGIYSFDLATKTMDLKPVMTIPAGHPQSSADGGSTSKKGKKKGRKIKPSEIVIDPRSGALYALNGPESELLILDQKGNLKQTIQLDKDVFPQPEGMCFSPSGELYISSEGGKRGKGVIAKVELK